MVTVSEEEIAEAIAWLSHAHEARVEGSGAVGVAALRSGRATRLEGPVAVVVSGGNIDEQRWRAIVDGSGVVA
jgi:threonine dehydratase